MKNLLLLVGLHLIVQTAFSQTSYTWNGVTSTAWNTATNWTPNGIPGTADNVTIVTGSNTCQLNASKSITNITVTSGTLDLGGFTLTPTGNAVFTAGTVKNGNLTISASVSATATLTNTTFATNANLTITSGAINLNGGTYFGPVVFNQTGSANNTGNGGATFDSTLSITNSGSGYYRTNGNVTYNGTTTFVNSGSGYFLPELSTGNTYNCNLTITNTSATQNVRMAYAGNTKFNGNVILNNTGGANFTFCEQSSATATLGNNATISIGVAGFTVGNLSLARFTQTGSTAQNLALTGAGGITFGPSSSFGGNVTCTSPTLFLNGCVFTGTSSFTKTGTTGDYSSGGNTFNGVSAFVNSGSSFFLLGNNNPDIWNSDVTFTDNGSERLLPCWGSTGNQFNGNIIVNSSGSAQGIQLCGGNNTATATQAAGKTVLAGSTGLTAGSLILRQFTQLGNTPVTLTGTGTSALYFGPFSSFGGVVTATAPDIWAMGATYSSAVTFTKTGGGSNHNYQYQNIFNSTLTINQQSNGGYFMLGFNSNDLFNDNITVTCTGSGGINLGWNSGTGTPTLAAGKTILIGAAGFSAGYLNLNTFTQLGNAPINLTFSGANSGISFARSSVIGGSMTVTAPDILLSGCTFNSTTSFTKNGGAGDYGQGGNTFNDVCTIVNNGSGYFVAGGTNPDIWNSDVTFTNNGSERLLPGWSSVGNQFNGNITVNTSGSAQGIQFCGGSATATATQAAGKTIQAGSTGLTAGYLYLRQFTQLGNAPITLTGTGTSVFYFGPYSSFGGSMTATAPDIWVQGATYNGAASFTKTGGSSNHNNQYQNIFNSTCTINQQSNTGYFMLGYNSNDLFNDNITLTSTGTGGINLGWSSGTGTPTLASGKTIFVGAAGFSAGYLNLNTFTQLGNAPMNLVFTGTSTPITFARNSVIGGDLVVSTSDIYLNGSTFNGASAFTKTGTAGNYSSGGNIFNGVCTVTNNGTSFFLLGNNNPDIWNADVTFTDNGSERVLPCWGSAGNQFNGNIFVNTSGSAQGVYFCGGNATATATLAAGKTIQAGSTGLNAGYLILKQFTQLGNAPVNLSLSSTASALVFGPSSAIGGNMVTSSPSLYFYGCVFSGTVNSTKTGPSSDASTGSNVFNAPTVITDQGGQILFGNGNSDQFNDSASFINNGVGNFYIAYNSAGNLFNGPVTLTNSPAGNVGMYVSWNSAGTVFNKNITVSSTSGQGVQFCGGNNTASATLAAGNTISVGPGGFSTGTLLLRQFTQVGSTTQSLTLTGTGVLTFGPVSSFGGDITTLSPSLFFNGCTFNGVSNFTKNGATGDYSNGGNIFNGVSSITNSGTSYLLLGNTNPDIWNNDVTFTNNGSERLLPCWATVGNQFNGNIYVNTGGSAQGIQFCGGNSTATAVQAATKSIFAGSSGLNAGYLVLRQFTQLGNAPVNLTLSNTATYLQFGPLSAIGGNTVTSSPGLYFHGCVFSGTVNSTKTGSSNDASNGSNVFNGAATMTNAGSGYLMFGNGNADQFNSVSTFNNTGSSNIYVANNSTNNIFGGVATFNNTPTANTLIYVSPSSAGTVFNDNIVVSSTGGQGVQFCSGNTTATATLAAGKTIAVGAGGFSAGTLLLRQFTQTGATPQTLTLTGTGNLTFGPLSAFGGNTTTVSPTLFFNGCNFGGTVNSTKNGGTSDGSIGNNVFNGAFVVTNTGAGYFMMGNGNPDIWQSTAVFNNQSTGQHLYTAYNSTGNTFNGDVTYNNQPGSTGLWIYANNSGAGTQFNGNIIVTNVTGGGVYFGNGTGTASLASGKTISVGGSGFTLGGLILRNFTQVGSGTSQTITTTGTSYLQYGPSSTFNGTITSSSPGLLFTSSVFNGTISCTKTGTTNDQSPGNNIFNGSSTFTNSGTGYLMMTNSSPDTYNGNTSFVQTSTGAVYPNYNGTSAYNANVSVTSLSAITFGANSTGAANFSGSGAQKINATAGTPTPVFTRLIISNTGGGVTLNTTSVNVSGSLTLNSGLLNTSPAYILTMLNGSTTAAGNALSTSYVNGPMRYQKSSSGATTLNFPIGTSPDCRPVVLTVNHSSSTLYTYTAQLYIASAKALNYALPPTIQNVSEVHYYTINRTDASNTNQPSAGLNGNQTIQIFFGQNDSVTDGSTLSIAKNVYTAPTNWIDIGGIGGPAAAGGAFLTGSITSNSTPSSFTSFSTFTLANKIGGNNVLPVGLLYFTAKADNNAVDLTWSTSTETNNSYFTVERSVDGILYDSLQRIDTRAFNGNSSSPLSYATVDPDPNPGNNYYRLRQTDINGNSVYSKIAVVSFGSAAPVAVYPNPSPGTVYISGIAAGEVSLKVSWYDISGRLLLQGMATVQNGTVTLNTHFTTGLYLLTFSGSDGVLHQQKIMIRH